MPPTPTHRPSNLSRRRFQTASAGLATIFLCVSAAGCASPANRLLDPAHAGETHRAEMRFRFERGASPEDLLRQIRPGDIIALSADEPGSQSSNVLATAFSTIAHVGIVFVLSPTQLRVFSSDSDRGSNIGTIERCLGGRDFFVYSFEEGLLDQRRLSEFAVHAAGIGVLDYDWSAVLGINANLTPNKMREISDEYTCATAVAAALHYAGVSLDEGWMGMVTPYDVISSVARRNLNGPGASREPESAGDEDSGGSGRAGRP